VDYRVTAGLPAIFYLADVIDIHDREHALQGIKLFIDDDASTTRPLIGITARNVSAVRPRRRSSIGGGKWA